MKKKFIVFLFTLIILLISNGKNKVTIIKEDNIIEDEEKSKTVNVLKDNNMLTKDLSCRCISKKERVLYFAM